MPNVISHSISPILGNVEDKAIGIAPNSLSETPFIEDVRPQLAHETVDSEFGDFASVPVADGVSTPQIQTGPEETSNEMSPISLKVKDDALDVAPNSPSGDLVKDVQHQLATEPFNAALGGFTDVPMGGKTVEEVSNHPGHNAQVPVLQIQEGAGNGKIVEPTGVEDGDFSV
eukprot:scaffold208718_cov26-Attheya_sp.AAC.1